MAAYTGWFSCRIPPILCVCVAQPDRLWPWFRGLVIDQQSVLCVPSSNEEITAWHEAGHAFVAVYLGGQIESVSVDPDRDDGPARFGDTTVRWQRGRFTEQQLQQNAILVALAGPVAEMIHRGDPFHPATVAEWSQDWQLAWQAAAFIRPHQRRMEFLEALTVDLHRTLSRETHWAAIGAIVDHLLAYEQLEGETVEEIVSEWTE